MTKTQQVVQTITDPIYVFIRDRVAEGQAGAALQQALRERFDLSAEQAEQALLDYLSITAKQTATELENAPERRRLMRGAGLSDMILGGGLVALAVFITLSTLEMGGGVLLLLSGLIVYGGYRFIEGLWALVRGK